MTKRERREKIVVIEGDARTRLSSSYMLESAGYQVYAFEDAAQGLDAVTRLQPDLVVVALRLPDLPGTDVITCIRNMNKKMAIVAITSYPTAEDAAEAVEDGADGFLVKPFSADVLGETVDRALQMHDSNASSANR